MENTATDPAMPKQLTGKKKKKLLTKIKTQMEFYFSDSNIAKDKFLQKLIEQDPDGYVDLEIFKTFNKIKALTTDIDIISAAVSKSHFLQVSDDNTKIKRITAATSPKDYDACTIYAEKLPPFADHKWIKDVFEHFGTVDHVNIPRFKVTQKIKGFAFIEFSKPESVEKACEYYRNARSKALAEKEAEAIKLKQVNTRKSESDHEKSNKKRKTSFKTEQSAEKVSESHIAKSTPKDSHKKLDRISDNEKTHKMLQGNKKRKRDSSDSQTSVKKHCSKDALSDNEEITKNKKIKEETAENIRIKEEITDITYDNKEIAKVTPKRTEKQLLPKDNPSATETDPNSDGEFEGKSTRKRKHKKKNLRDERPILRVMSKHEWKVYRNKYLELQRATMSKLKKQIMLETQEWKEQEASIKTETPTESPKKSVQFQPGVIIKIKLSNPIESVTDIKDRVKANSVVAYIDAPLGHTEMFVRCNSPEDAQSIIQERKFHCLGSAEILKDSEEEAYWKKIEEDKKIKFSMPPTHKKRGRDKIIAKAIKLEEQKNKHIYFDE